MEPNAQEKVIRRSAIIHIQKVEEVLPKWSHCGDSKITMPPKEMERPIRDNAETFSRGGRREERSTIQSGVQAMIRPPNPVATYRNIQHTMAFPPKNRSWPVTKWILQAALS